MAAGTVSYTDTTGNRDYLGMIASQIGRRLKEASDMASDERDFAERKAEEGGTSLGEAGIGRGYFFRRALGSRFGGDKIARTKGRLGVGGAGTNPTGDFKSRFRGGFDYNVTNEISAATAPLSNAVVAGLRGVESGLIGISQALNNLSRGMNDLAKAQEDVAKQAILNGAFMQAFLNHMQREAARQRARSEERGLERGLLEGGSGGGGRNMINVTPPSTGRSGDIGDATRRLVKQALPKGSKATTTAAKALRASSQIKKGAAITDLGNVAVKGSSFTRPITKGMVAMGTKMPGVNTVTNLFRGSEQFMGPGVGKIITKAFEGGQGIKKVKKLAKSMVTAGSISGPVSVLEHAIPKITGDHIGSLTSVAKSGSKTKKLVDTGTIIAGGSKEGIELVTQSGELMDGARKASAATDGVSTAKTIAAATDAGANPSMLKRFLFGTKPKGLVRGSKLTRMLIKNPAGKVFLKKLPLIGALAGTVFAAQRLLEGDFLGAGLEFGSGILGATGAAPASLAIDGFLLARDFGAVPFEQGGIVTRPTLSMMGERNKKEGVFPLEGALGKKTFKMFGQGVVDAREENESGETKLLALGQKRYFESMDGWSGFADAIVESFTNFRDKVGDIISDANPFNQENLANINNSGATNTIRNVIGSEKDDGFIGPKWLGIKNPFADQQANALNNNSAQMTNGGMGMTTTVINNYNGAIVGDGSGDSGSGSSSLDAYAAFTQQFSLSSK